MRTKPKNTMSKFKLLWNNKQQTNKNEFGCLCLCCDANDNGDRGNGNDVGGRKKNHQLPIAPDIILFDIYSSRNDNTSRHVKK